MKYGEFRYLKRLVEEGALRVSPASMYGDASLNRARRDSELEVTAFVPAHEARVWTAKGSFPIVHGPLKITVRRPRDHYVYCLAKSYNFRLFDDFEADSCVIIHRPVEFHDRLRREMDRRLPGWTIGARAVDYFDPFQVSREQLRSQFAKNFKFAYQEEYRILWNPPGRRANLEPLDISLGPLQNCCELVRLDLKPKNE